MFLPVLTKNGLLVLLDSPALLVELSQQENLGIKMASNCRYLIIHHSKTSKLKNCHIRCQSHIHSPPIDLLSSSQHTRGRTPASAISSLL